MTIKISEAVFVKSSADVVDCPQSSLPEYAFIGRSNVGKSSLINMICGRSDLAKVSSTPGKTQLINHFCINKEWHLVDLPGYGYAKLPKPEKVKLQKIIDGYIIKRQQLTNLFLLIDCRHEAQKIDLEFIEFLGTNGVPFTIVFTKADKLSEKQLTTNIDNYKQTLLESWEELPPMIVTSSLRKTGRDEILDYIESINTSLAN